MKETITYQYVLNYKIIAISSHLKDYRVSFYLNNLLGLNLTKIDNLIIDNKKKENTQSFEQQQFIDTQTELSYHLIQNKTQGGYFLPSLKKFDYLLILKSENEIENYEEIFEKIRQSDRFLIAYKASELSKKENKIIETYILYND